MIKIWYQNPVFTQDCIVRCERDGKEVQFHDVEHLPVSLADYSIEEKWAVYKVEQ